MSTAYAIAIAPLDALDGIFEGDGKLSGRPSFISKIN